VSQPVYLDHAASTPCDPRVVEAMTPYFTAVFANPSSKHHAGAHARAAVEQARAQAAALIGCRPGEIVWTSGATEADNLAIKGVAAAVRAAGGRHIVTSAIEHQAVLQPCRQLAEDGFDVTVLPPGPAGVVEPGAVEAALRDDTVMVSIMGVNNEIGTISDITAIGAACRARGVLFHTDATQMIGLLPIDVDRDGIDLLSWSGHKIGAPKGVGGLYVRDREPPIRLRPLIAGGGHEAGRRSGTLNVPGIVGLGHACELCRTEMAGEARHHRELRDRIEAGLRERVGDIVIVGAADRRAPHISALCFPAAAGTRLIERISGLCCSSGAAAGGSISHVLAALGVPRALAMTSLRLSLGRTTTAADADAAIERISEAVHSHAPGGHPTPAL